MGHIWGKSAGPSANRYPSSMGAGETMDHVSGWTSPYHFLTCPTLAHLELGKMSDTLLWDCLLPGFFSKLFPCAQVSVFTEINSDLVRLHFWSSKSFPLWVDCLKYCIWRWKKKTLPKCKHHWIEETVFFFQLHSSRSQTTLNPLQKHISHAILPLK